MFNPTTGFLRPFALGMLIALAGTPAFAADAPPDTLADMQKKLDQSLQMIQALAARVKELEAGKAAATTAAAPAAPGAPASPGAAPAVSAAAATPAAATPAADAAVDQRLQSVEQQVAQIETANATRRSDDTGLPIHGFADLDIGNHNPFHRLKKARASTTSTST